MMTIAQLIQSAVPVLADAGVDTPRLDAELLLAASLGVERTYLWMYPEREVDDAQAVAFHARVARRVKREPLAYITGEKEFYGRAFMVTPAVLIPRPETELLVEAVLDWICAHGATQIADIGTGSGAIAISLALALPVTTHIYAMDISAAALAVARRNMQHYHVAERIDCAEGDGLAPLWEQETVVDVIVANLPYIPDQEMPTLMPEVRDYEPVTALCGGPDGLALITRLIADAPRVLRPGGLLALELGQGQPPTVQAVLAEQGWVNIRVIVDYGGIARHVLAELPVDMTGDETF